MNHISVVEFEWDEPKSERNVRAPGLPFDVAVRLFDGPVLERRDERRDYGETRVIATREVAGEVLTCVYTDREQDGEVLRRIISLRRASRRERERYADRKEGTE